MAVGFSGSNGGISSVYIRFIEVDITAGLSKYRRLLAEINALDTAALSPEKKSAIVRRYESVINALEGVHTQMAGSPTTHTGIAKLVAP